MKGAKCIFDDNVPVRVAPPPQNLLLSIFLSQNCRAYNDCIRVCIIHGVMVTGSDAHYHRTAQVEKKVKSA